MVVKQSTKNLAIQQLRGVAILLVLLHHLSIIPTILIWAGLPESANSGWIGVELFFVISGLVVTRSLHNSNFQMGRFFKRRFWRLFPCVALFLVLVLLTNHYLVLNFPTSPFLAGRESVWHEVLMSLSGTYTIFSGIVPTSLMFGAMWSLSVEEQFYLGVGLCLAAYKYIFKNHFHRNNMKFICAMSGILLGAAVCLRLLGHYQTIPIVSYFLSWRFDFLIAGVFLETLLLLGVLPSHRVNRLSAPLIWSLILVSLFLIAFMGSIMDPSAQPIIHGLGHPVLLVSFVLVVYLATSGCPLGFEILFLNRALTWIGDRSYTIYVFHFLIFSWSWILMNYIEVNWSVYGLWQLILTTILGFPIYAFIYEKFESPLTKMVR